ncbi:hypothetical protein QAD02_000021 [Eretmocerus hayati]|uniref:Uncharacterized protein n=1 Tax=Eretmocerus hayati TaxID=131215 RepID=A0ACC2NC92_9HYME|nr:hypothetical protein QAD02_000021 [Eretmocerus hayati]
MESKVARTEILRLMETEEDQETRTVLFYIAPSLDLTKVWLTAKPLGYDYLYVVCWFYINKNGNLDGGVLPFCTADRHIVNMPWESRAMALIQDVVIEGLPSNDNGALMGFIIEPWTLEKQYIRDRINIHDHYRTGFLEMSTYWGRKIWGPLMSSFEAKFQRAMHKSESIIRDAVFPRYGTSELDKEIAATEIYGLWLEVLYSTRTKETVELLYSLCSQDM